MKVFLLQADSDHYQTLVPKNEDDFDLIYKINGVEIGGNWRPFMVEPLIESQDEENLPSGDFTLMTTSALPVFSNKSVNALREKLLSNGELLPVVTDRETYFVYNITTLVDALDIQKCDAEYFTNGKLMVVRTYSFFYEKLRGLVIFKVPQFPLGPVFVTDEFVKQVERQDLKGFKFKSVWEEANSDN